MKHLVEAPIDGYDKCVDLLSKSDASMRKCGNVVSLRKTEELLLEYLLLTTASPRSGCGTPATLMLLCVASKIAHLPPAGVTALLLPTQPVTQMLLCAAPLIARLPPTGVAPLLLPTQKMFFLHRMKKPLL